MDIGFEKYDFGHLKKIIFIIVINLRHIRKYKMIDPRCELCCCLKLEIGELRLINRFNRNNEA